jgi:hypothetical protein
VHSTKFYPFHRPKRFHENPLQLSNNSLVNLVVIFGLPIITAVLSVMGAGPLAIATTAWMVPIAAVLVLPDFVQR